MNIRPIGLLLLLLAIAPLAGQAHEVLHSVAEGGAVVVELAYADGSPFSFESYELFRPGESVPVQVGRTDYHGRIVFVPDTGGEWRIRAFSEDGHGADFAVNTDAKHLLVEAESGSLRLHEKILLGVGWILGIFGIIALAYRRKRV